jgi:hypothetical protein
VRRRQQFAFVQVDACGLNLHELPIDWQSDDAG